MSITIKSAEDIEAMRVAGQLAASVLAMIRPHVQPGISTEELDAICHRFIVEELDAVPAPLNYRGFPKSICTSVNDVVCHGIPDHKTLKDGDIINIDITVIKNEFHGDTSTMMMVGSPNQRARHVAKVAHDAMCKGIELVRPGVHLGDIGHTIQQYVEKSGCSVVREYCGHGIGRVFHEDPQVLHYGKPGTRERLEAGMCFTIEPMVNAGKRHVKLKRDGWTVVTKDRSPSAQWEHTLAVLDDGFEVMTCLPGDGL